MTTVTACRTCGTELLANARFCHGCGSPVAESDIHAEYKQVTVLFADVVRSMAIAAVLDVERLREIVTDLVERSAAVVRRYGGIVEHTGDGVMAIFGAPVAMEDHAFRACLAALAIQEEANRLAVEVQRRDGVALLLRVGLNSGRVIAGELGSGSLGYAATGEHVGMAHRIESVAPPGAVMLSEATARLVEHLTELTEAAWVHIKGADEPVRVRRLVAIGPPDGPVGRAEASLVGRRWEMAALDAMVDRTIGGRGEVVNVVGPPGIGKSRTAREVAAAAAGRGVEVFWTFCESHAWEVPFHAVTRLLRAGIGVADLDGEAARSKVRQQISDADAGDLLLLDDLLGIADPEVALPAIDPDARRRRLTALINTASLARTEPALFVIEDAHWIDAVSESMLADLLAVFARTPSMVLITFRTEYEGALTRVPGAKTIALAPLADSSIVALLGEVLGSDPSVGELAAVIAERAAGNPFFAEEMVRELVQRGVLTGERGGFVCRADVAEVSVPATVQAAIAARIDRLSAPAKQTVYAASVMGARFGAELLAALSIDAVFDELLGAELIDQVRFTPSAEYVFHHPLIRTVAYESQLKSDRAQLHRRLAVAIEAHDRGSVDDNAALIAEHLQAAGDLHAAYAWHMRAGGWAAHRDAAAACLSWERARQVADALPADDADRTPMRIAPRTLLCGNAFRVHADTSGTPFEELRQLCTAAGDKRSLAVGMAGLVTELFIGARVREGSRLASELMALVESIGDPTLMVGVAISSIATKIQTGEMAEALRWTQSVIDLAEGDPARGNLITGSPLAVALAMRGTARWALGRSGWRDDLQQAVAMARGADPMSHAQVITYKYLGAIPNGVLIADDAALRELDEAVRIAERSSDDLAFSLAQLTLGVALVHRDSPDERERGSAVLCQVRAMCLQGRFYLSERPVVEVWVAREMGRRGDRDAAIPRLRVAVDDLFEAGMLGHGMASTGALAETLLARAAEGDVQEAANAIDRLAVAPADDDFVAREIWLLRLRALLARARHDEVRYRDLVDRYRAIAASLGFDGHIAMAEAMTRRLRG